MKSFIKTAIFLISIIGFSQTDTLEVISLWENGAPGFEHLRNEPEQAKDWWVKNINNPSITVYKPKAELANGTVVLICPGGGHRELVFDAEGTDAALFLNSLGITAFVLKYRLAREEGSPYNLNIHPKQDAQRALRLIRHHAEKWKINSDKIGMLGFSAGGEVVSMAAYESNAVNEEANNSIDKLNGKPDFQMLVYPGPLGIPEKFPNDAPPVFMVVANDDTCCSEPVMGVLKGYRDLGISAEAHIYAKGGHAFNMGYRTELKTLRGWPQRMADWLSDNGYLNSED